MEARCGEDDRIVFRCKVVSWAERGAKGERIGCILGEVEVVLGLEVGVRGALSCMRRLLWDDGASEDDEGDECEEDKPYSIGDPEALLAEAGGGLLAVGEACVAGAGRDADVSKTLACTPLHDARVDEDGGLVGGGT